jgi:uncharacterized repeat protein (TIGR04052 family)
MSTSNSRRAQSAGVRPGPSVSRAVVVLLGSSCLAAACTTGPAAVGPGAQNGAQAGAQPVEIRFEARVGDKIAKCGETYINVGSSKASILLQDIRIYVSNARLIAKDGHEVPVALTPDGQWQNGSVTLLDFEDRSGNCNGNAATNRTIQGTVPAGDYKGVAFDIGVPSDLNHKDPTLAAAPLNVTALTWPWRIGYKFTTIDLETASKPVALAAGQADHTMPGMKMGEAASGFSIHLGSTECGDGSPMTPPSAPCGNPNRPGYRLERFNLKSQSVVFDLGALLANTDVTVNAPGSMSGCMAFVEDDDCIAVMDRFGLAFRGKPSSGQVFVRAD